MRAAWLTAAMGVVSACMSAAGCGEPAGSGTPAPPATASAPASPDSDAALMEGPSASANPAGQPAPQPRRVERPEARYGSVRIDGVPHILQKPDFCGEACAAMALGRLGLAADQDYVFDQSGLDPLQGRGCYTRELAAALKKIGFRIGPVWHKVAAQQAERELESLWAEVHADLARGVPSILCMHYDDGPQTTEHFRLIVGYDAETDEVLYHEPAEADGAYRRMPRATLLRLWPLKYDRDQWSVISLRLMPGTLRPVETAVTFTAADYAQHIRKLKTRLPESDHFSIVIQAPFVVIGNESAAMVERRAESTVKWAVERLKKAYFEKDPAEIIDIWLFKDKDSYERHAQELFGAKPGTPFGYYSPRDKALVMNISTGGGTLVHEIVHPFVAANFPQCPSWFNEGLGSLYEQCGDRDGRITGYTNWRLAGLQQAIRTQSVPSFETLCSTGRNEFYNSDRGTNYAQARYLCYYLQERDLLGKFYHRFRDNCREDPTGYQTLKAVLGSRDMDAFQKEWQQYVLKLRFE